MAAVFPRQKKNPRNKVEPDDLLGTEQAVAEACNVGRWTVTAVKKASRGMPDNPWSGRFTTKRRFSDWLFKHPEFRAYKVLRKKTRAKKSKVAATQS
jgi:hypothetical protein